jgi:hypothetical protein
MSMTASSRFFFMPGSPSGVDWFGWKPNCIGGVAEEKSVSIPRRAVSINVFSNQTNKKRKNRKYSCISHDGG